MNTLYLLYAAGALYLASFIAGMFRMRIAGIALLGAGAAAHLSYQVSRAWLTGFFLPNAMFDGVFLLPLAIAVALLAIRLFSEEDENWERATAIVCMFMVFAFIYPKGIIPPTPNKLTVWAQAFFLTESAGHACFYLGAWGAMYNLIRKKDYGLFHTLIVWGFVLFSISQVTGAIWAYLGWGSTFRWGARHLQTAVIWLYYVNYLHLRFLPSWSAARRYIYAALGAIVTIACSFGSYLGEMSFPRVGG
ncbi:MAG: hypothetical protein EPN93_15320 [Spirochaetes bacterium]|nr:MAG: hypothetical protein EPN93_15320 [Spirochaetota bacterium]